MTRMYGKMMQQTWDEIGPNKYLSIVPGLKEAMTLGGNVPTLEDMPVAAMLKTASFIITPGDEIAKPGSCFIVIHKIWRTMLKR